MAVVFHEENNGSDLNSFINTISYKRKLIVSSTIEHALLPKQAHLKLGEEYDFVFFDARDSFEANALGIVSGVLCGGGCLVIYLPEKDKWAKDRSLFSIHINDLLNEQTGVYYFNNNVFSEKTIISETCIQPTKADVFPFKTHDQKNAVETIINEIEFNDQYHCVLTAGRGRGKSSALGFIASKLIRKNQYKILLTAPKLSVSAPLFKHLNEQCPEGAMEKSSFEYKNSELSFIAPDLLLNTLPEANVLFIDEAAAIPLSMLKQLLTHYSKIIFSTTTHGYEGTGNGFALKFYNILDEMKPDWRKVLLHQPIRWAEHDPLERWIEELLYLNVNTSNIDLTSINLNKREVILIDRKKLIEDKVTSNAIFSLLVSAHYRTSPADFQYILDSDNVRVYIIKCNNIILGVLLVNQEGGFSAELSKEIYQGRRRPKGNLLPQTLCFHAGSELAPTLTYSRVMRIAIHLDAQQMGLGSYLLEQVIINEKKLGIDIFGTSFSATEPLLRFWEKSDLSLLRIGFSRDHVTAAHSAVMAKPLSQDGVSLIENLTLKFNSNIKLWIDAPLCELSDELKQYALKNEQAESKNGLTSFDVNDVVSFAKFNRNYDACMPAIRRYINYFLNLTNDINGMLNEQEKEIILLNIRYSNNWKTITKKLGSQSKSQSTNLLRTALAKMLDYQSDHNK